MAKQLKVIAPCAHTPAPTGSSGIRTSGRMPEELLRDQVRRLGASTVVIAGCWTFGLVMDTLIGPALGFPRRGVSTVIAVAGIALSAAMFAYLRSSAHRSETKTTMGLVFMVLNALGIALMNASALGAAMLNIPMVSWTAVLILIFATISPTSPRRMLVASARCRHHGSAGRLDWVLSRRSGAGAAHGRAPLPAELHLGVHRDGAVQGDAGARQTAARGAGPGQL